MGPAARPESFPSVDRYLEEVVTSGKTPSVSVAVVKNGKPIYTKAFGYADLENRVPAAPKTVYRLGSITKQFTATMIMQLVEAKKLTLDQTIGDLLPKLPATWHKVTVRQLLNHTSGIKSYTEVPGLFAKETRLPVKPEGILDTVKDAPLDFEPGTKWNYNNSGYEVLGLIIEKLDGQTYALSLKKRILDPLGMSSTYFVPNTTIVPLRAHGYVGKGNDRRNAEYLDMSWPYAAGSMESTTLDLAKWDEALYGNRILSPSSLSQMWTRTQLAGGETEGYGFGWQLAKTNDIEIVQHGGGINGFSTFIRRAPSQGLTVIVLTNAEDNDPGAIANRVMGEVEPKLKVAPPKAQEDQDTAMTADARKVFVSLLDGTLDRSRMAPDFAKRVTPEMQSQVQNQLKALGALKDFKFVREDEQNGIRNRSYRATFGTTALLVTIGIDKDSKIAGLRVQPTE